MSSNRLVLIERHNTTTILTLNRHEKRNALSSLLMEQLCEAIAEAENRAEQRALILTGNGTVFCAGLDLEEAANAQNPNALAQLIAKTLTALYTSKLATIAALNGMALAGGAGLMSACDFVLASPEAAIGYPEVRRGLVAAQVMTLLIRQVGWRNARELLMLGESISPQRGVEIGLVNGIVSNEDLLAEAIKLGEKVALIDVKPFETTKKLLFDLEARPFKKDLEMALVIHNASRMEWRENKKERRTNDDKDL